MCMHLAGVATYVVPSDSGSKFVYTVMQAWRAANRGHRPIVITAITAVTDRLQTRNGP